MRLALLVVGFASLVSCTPGSTVGPLHQVSGVVVAGPTCPVETDPPQPGCEPRLVNGAVLVVTDSLGNEASRVTTEADGSFEIDLADGAYTLTPQPVEGLMGTADVVTFHVTEDLTLDPIVYDTGIR